jgi:hypothetical protein
MRLLNATSLKFEVFSDDQLPPYAILSHTWGDEEVSYQDMRLLHKRLALPEHLRDNEILVAAMEAAAGCSSSITGPHSIRSRAGYSKLQMTSEIARGQKLNHFWIDTCCIDKSSSAELQESINSMYRWYRQSSFCVVYLEDTLFNASLTSRWFGEALRASRWITRGWTLQELIAPTKVIFYDQNWKPICSKGHSISTISKITAISEQILSTGDLSQASVAQKMSWAADRQTTRMEDRAYSLMGFFGIHMPMLYGEGENAFRRLQEEIIRTTPDDSIFAWRVGEGSLSTYCGLLATSPDDFRHSNRVRQGRSTFGTSNLGLRIETLIAAELTGSDGHWDESLFCCFLDAKQGEGVISLLVRRLTGSRYARVMASHFASRHFPTGYRETLYVEHTPQIPPRFTSRAMRYFHIKCNLDETAGVLFQIHSARPYDLWDTHRNQLLIPQMYFEKDPSQSHDWVVAGSTTQFVGMVWFNQVSGVPNRPLCSVLLGYDISNGRVWCKLLEFRSTCTWPAPDASTDEWRRVMRESYGISHQPAKDSVQDWDQLRLQRGQVSVKITPGLRRGLLSHIVDVDFGGFRKNPPLHNLTARKQ